MKNPNFRATLPSGEKIDINLNAIAYYQANGDNTNVTFTNGTVITINESARTVRGGFRKMFPEAAGEAEEG